MARMRYVKPETWTDSNMIKLSPFARLLFIGSWNFAMCDNGHLPDDPQQLKLQVLPADNVDAVALVDELVDNGRLVRVEGADGRIYLQVKRLSRHQKVDKRWTPRCPACGTEQSNTQPSSPELSGTPRDSPELSDSLPKTPKEGRGGDRRGGEGRGEIPPPPRCPQHVDKPSSGPCGQCKEHRIAREKWDSDNAERVKAERVAIHACRLCDGEGWRWHPEGKHRGVLSERCDHRPVWRVS
ncbi:hypothetical protein [Prauserella endophytica]|uniref:Uncharacterized protein n=1 Tax=Prauserella endophytica TaxID=1592324 RepID=A0ABY2S1Y8_9PSEU|nr:hypothetical protein [Prauserella endophytica]TKG67031.1 hypothetical protein FCN18_24300 [Prauserella endophytica]